LHCAAARGTFASEETSEYAMLNATERKALTLTTFVAACVCFAPAEIVSGIFLLLVSLLLFRWDRAMLLREASSSSSALSPGPEGGGDGAAEG
jgi:hypothetical protein